MEAFMEGFVEAFTTTFLSRFGALHLPAPHQTKTGARAPVFACPF
jgi:hypothetical protein